MKREFSLFLAIFLISFLFLPQTVFAEEINLSNDDIFKLFPSLQSGVMEQWINLTSSGAFSEPEKQAAFYLVRGAIQKKQLNYILVDLPKEGLIKLYQLGVFLMGAPDAGAIFSKIEKLTVEQAVNTAKEWFLQNQTKVATGTLNYSFKSYNGNQQNTTFYYNLVYKPRGNNYIDLAIEFYSPENIEPKDSVDHIVGLNTWCWDFNDWQKKGDKYIKPFIFKINGRILHDDQTDSYTWKQTLSSEITFPASVPKIEVVKQPTILDQIKEGLTKKFVENVLHIPYSLFTIVQDKIIDFINTSILKQNKPPQKAEITEVLSEAIDQKIITPEKIIDIAQTEIKKSEAPNPQIKQETKSKISLEEAQEILDDIAEKIDILTQQAEKLTGVKTTNTTEVVIKEEIKKLDQEAEEEIEEKEEVQKKEKAPTPSIAICQKTPGYHPVHNSIILNEIAWMGTTTSSNSEWIELKNMSNNPIDLTNWQLLDKDQNIKIIFTNKDQISARGFYLLERSNDDAVPGVSADSIYTGSLNNNNEALYLFDPSCQLQDEIEIFSNWSAGDNDSKRTIERKSIFEWQTSNNIGGTPKNENSSGYIETPSYIGGRGGGNSPSPSYSKILISEIQISPITERFIELYNPNNSVINLTDWYVQRKTQTGSDFIPLISKTYFNGKTINAYGYFLISRSALDEADIVLNNLTLAESNVIQLKNPNGETVDKVGWGQAQDFEISPTQNPQLNQTIGRKWDETVQGYQDTNNNQQDFEIQSPTPKAKNRIFSDIVPPETVIDSKPLNLTNQTQAIFTLSSSEENSTFECKIDDENWQVCSSTQQYSDLINGSHIFQVRAKDANQNLDSTPAQHQWTIDNVPPQTEISTHPPSLTNQAQANFTFFSNEENSTFECKIDESEWENCQSPKIYNDLAEGEHAFSIRGEDSARNLETSPSQYFWQIDTTIQNASLSFSSIYTKERTINIVVANDDGAIEWLLSENEAEIESSDILWQTEKPTTFTLSEGDGPKTVYLWIKDESENISSEISAQITLDTTPPSVQFNSLAQIQTSTDFDVSWSGNDATADISEYHLKIRKESEEESLDWQTIPEEIYQFSGPNGNTYYFKIRAKDKADNLSEWSSEISTQIQQPILSVFTDNLTFEAIEFGQNPATQNLEIKNAGFGNLNWGIVVPEVDWLNFDSTSGQAPSNISVSVNISDLEAGQFQNIIEISSNGGSEEIEVALNLQEDIIPPEPPQILSPQNNQIFNTENVNLSGTTEPNAIILISSLEIRADENGNWQKEIELIEGQNEIEVKAKDEAGNESEATILNLILDTHSPIVVINQLPEIESSLSFIVSWSGDDNYQNLITSGIDGFQLRHSEDGEIWIYWPSENEYTTDIQYNFTGEDGKSYYFQVKARDKAGNEVDEWVETLTEIRLPITPLSIVINEIAWMGTSAGYQDEWIELYNNTDREINLSDWSLGAMDGIPEINLTGIIFANDFYLLERTNDTTVSDISANQIYTGALENDGEKLELFDPNNNLIDSVDCSMGWFKGGDTNKISMERINSTLNGSDPSNWANNNLITRNGLDAGGNNINGTPKAQNSLPLPEDTIPPEISDIQADISEASASIGWETNEESTSMVECGTTVDYGETKDSDDYLFSHSISLTNLESGTAYHYKVGSTDKNGNTSWSEDNTFTTTSNNPIITIFEDDFDSYNLGDLTGQGGWTAADNGSSYEVVDAYAHSGAKSIKCRSYYPCYIAKTGTNEINGILKIRFYIVAHDTFRNWDTTFTFRQSPGESTLNHVLLKDAGPPFDFIIWLGSTSQIYTNISPGQWYALKVEWNANTDKMRIQLDDLESSDWIDGNAVDYISTLEISNSVNAGRWIYLDTIE